RFRYSPAGGAWTRRLHRYGDRERTARKLLDGNAASAHGYLVGTESLLPGLSGGAGETRRQGLPLARHYCAGPADEPHGCSSRIPEKVPEGSRSAAQPV